MGYDAAGKVSLDHIYRQPDPRAYFGTLRGLDYRIPELAKPYFLGLIDELRAAGHEHPTVLDVGCGYGVNAAMLRYDCTMDELYRHYGSMADTATRADMVAADRRLFGPRAITPPTRLLGLDVSMDALDYARDAGFLDDAVAADLEQVAPATTEATLLGTADLVISTGCFGYVTEQTLLRIIDAGAPARPWMAHTVLRMYSFEPAQRALDKAGYVTVAAGELLRQRRFASSQEHEQVLATLSGLGIDPDGMEADGWLYAQLFVSRPVPD